MKAVQSANSIHWYLGSRFGSLCLLTAIKLFSVTASIADVIVVTDAEGQTVTTYASSHALVIGVSDYTAGWRDLPSIPNEIEQVAKTLEIQGFTVERVLNPNHERLESTLKEFVNSYGYDPNNRLLIFFAGHGYSRLVHGEQRGYLVPADAPVPIPKAMTPFLAKSVSMFEIVAWARRMDARHVLFIFDSCFSGTVLDARAGVPEPAHITSLTGRPVRQFLTAGSAGEEVPGTSVFVPTLVRALGGGGDLTGDGYVTGTELWVYLHQLLAGTGQTPQHGRLLRYQEGDFVFRLQFKEPPAISGFDLSDLEIQSDLESRWLSYQSQMSDAFSRAEGVESLGGTSTTKAVAWERFLAIFRADNPLSSTDDDLRHKAAERLSYWRQQPPEQPTVTALPANEAQPPSPGDAMVERALRMRFRYVPSGEIPMGSPSGDEGRSLEETRHPVKLQGFWMGEAEVSQAQWHSLMGTDPSHFSECGEECPVERVNWFETLEFANRLSERAGLTACYQLEGCTGIVGNGCDVGDPFCVGDYQCNLVRSISDCQGYRLPTESEWEWAARAEPTRLRTGETFERAATMSWGVQGLLRNVWEWVWDWYAPYPLDRQQDSAGQESGSLRVLRGCGGLVDGHKDRLSNRCSRAPNIRSMVAGFRLVRRP